MPDLRATSDISTKLFFYFLIRARQALVLPRREGVFGEGLYADILDAGLKP